MFSFFAEIPLFHVLNARITFGNVNKCSTEEEAKPTPAATPTSSGEDEEAAGRNATSSATTVYFLIVISDPPLFFFSSLQHCLCFQCVLQCLRCLPVTTGEEAADTRLRPTTTRSSCSTPSTRVSWSLAEPRARSELHRLYI